MAVIEKYQHSDSEQLETTSSLEAKPLPGLGLQNHSLHLNQNSEINILSQYLAMSAVAGICVLTIWGNSSIILCVIKNRRLSGTVYSVYILSLAMTDLFVGLAVIPAMAYYTYYGYWLPGYVPCTILIISDYSLCSVSIWHLSVISYDREKAVKEPLKYRSTFTKSRARKISATLWTLVFLFWIPSVTLLRFFEEVNGTLVEYDCYFLPAKYFRLAAAFIVFDLPIVFVAVEYVKLVICLQKRDLERMQNNQNPKAETRPAGIKSEPKLSKVARVTHAQSLSKKRLDTGTMNNIKHSGPQTGSSEEMVKVSSQNKQAIRTLGVMVVLFFICWVPWCSGWLIDGLCTSCVSTDAKVIIAWLTYSNSCVNPYLYFIFNSEFRSTLARLYFNICRGRTSI